MMLSINIKEPLMIKKLKLFFKISINMTGIPLKPIKIKTKDLESPWITKGTKKSSKKK